MSLNRRAAARQRGLSIVELMVGITIGLIVVAAASLVVTTQLVDNRRLLLETQLQQDLRATADIITRELRRADYYTLAYASIWDEADPAGVMPTPMGPMTPASGVATQVEYQYMRRPGDQGPYEFRLDNGAIQSKLGPLASWQDLTDKAVMQVTDFTVTSTDSQTFRLTCPQLCPPPGGPEACWPTLSMRVFDVVITAHAKSDTTVQRTLNTSVRVRNDRVEFDNPLNPICPG